MYEDDPQDQVHDMLGEAIFPDQPLGRPIIGTREVIGSISDADVRGHHAAYYTAPNIVVAAAGNITPEQTLALAERYLGGLSRTPAPGGAEPARAGAPRLTILEKPTEQVHLCLGGPGLSLSLAGDFNDWAPGQHVLDELAPGFYLVEAPVDAPQGLYKLVLDETEFFADPLARRFGWDQFGEYSQVDPLPDRGHHERWPAFDVAVGDLEPRTVTAWLPAGAFDMTDLPVVVMHDGQNLFSPDAFFGGWRVGEQLELAVGDGTLPPLVIVGVDNTPARFEEYTPVTDVLDGMRVGGRADEYADFLVQGVLPFAQERYPIGQGSSLVATMGSSLGGLVSLYLGQRHPDVFGHVASMSGTIDWGTFGASNPTIRDLYQDDPPLGLRLYVDSGGSEGTGCPADGSDNYCGNLALADDLRAMGWQDEVDLFYRWEPGAPHNEAAWADRLVPALVDWFPGG